MNAIIIFNNGQIKHVDDVFLVEDTGSGIEISTFAGQPRLYSHDDDNSIQGIKITSNGGND